MQITRRTTIITTATENVNNYKTMRSHSCFSHIRERCWHLPCWGYLRCCPAQACSPASSAAKQGFQLLLVKKSSKLRFRCCWLKNVQCHNFHQNQNLPKPALLLLDRALQMPTLRSSLPLLQRLRSPVFLFVFLNWWSENKKITAAIPTPVPAAPRPDPRTPKSAATWAGVTSNLASRSPGQWPPQRGFWTKISTNALQCPWT